MPSEVPLIILVESGKAIPILAWGAMDENGKIDPGISRLKKIADGLNVTIIDIFQENHHSSLHQSPMY